MPANEPPTITILICYSPLFHLLSLEYHFLENVSISKGHRSGRALEISRQSRSLSHAIELDERKKSVETSKIKTQGALEICWFSNVPCVFVRINCLTYATLSDLSFRFYSQCPKPF